MKRIIIQGVKKKVIHAKLTGCRVLIITFIAFSVFVFDIDSGCLKIIDKAKEIIGTSKGNGNIFVLFSHLKELLRLYIILNTLLPFFSYLAYFYACHVTTGVTQYFYLENH